jgi:hypothetical protein
VILLIVVGVLAGWTLLSLPLAVIVGRALAAGDPSPHVPDRIPDWMTARV